MMASLTKPILILSFLFTIGCGHLLARPRHYLCAPQMLLLKDLPSDIPLSDITVTFASHTSGSGVAFRSINSSDEVVTNIAGVIDLVGADHKSILDIPFALGLNLPRAHSLPFQVSWSLNLSTPIGVGDVIDVAGMSDFTTAQCPVSAKFTYFTVQFLNGKSYSYASKDWRVWPTVKTPTAFDLSNLPFVPPYELIVEANVNNYGKIEELHVVGSSADLEAWLKKQLSTWTFAPEIVNGTELPSTLIILLRFHAVYDWNDSYKFDTRSLLRSPALAVDVYPKLLPYSDQALFVGDALKLSPK